jgi:cytoskeleton protein RodZ
MSDESSPDQAASENNKGPSMVLAQARQKLGLSQKEVADKLFLTTSFITYIDDGDFDRFPKPAYVKGYLRSYARVVDLDGDDIVGLYESEFEASEPSPEMRGVTDEDVSASSITGPVLQTGLFGLIGLIVVVALIWWLVSDSEPEEPIRISNVAQQQVAPAEPDAFEFVLPDEDEAEAFRISLEGTVEGSPSLDLESGNDQAESLQEALDAAEGPSARVENAALSNESGRREPVQVGTAEGSIRIERSQDGARSFVTVDAGGFDQLELSFKDECWVEIDDGKHGVIYNDLNKSDDLLTIYGTAPFKVLLGKATGVEMIYNGRPFDLEPHISRDRTAKLTISE